jgi:hypothetical protein
MARSGRSIKELYHGKRAIRHDRFGARRKHVRGRRRVALLRAGRDRRSQRPKRRAKTVALLRKPLPFEVLSLIAGMRETLEKDQADWRRDGYRRVPRTRQFEHGDHDKHVLAEACAVIESIGGVSDGSKAWQVFRFDYEPADVLSAIVTSGCIPDNSAHQFYPTPASVAEAAAELADIGPADSVLEPSAWNGDLAAVLPADRTLCVEVAPLRCAVLKAKGFATIDADFIAWAAAARLRSSRRSSYPLPRIPDTPGYAFTIGGQHVQQEHLGQPDRKHPEALRPAA